jgi:lipoate-protein ligase A
MQFIDNQNHTDPRMNLAIEEHLLRNIQCDNPLFLLYINEPSVIIGRNQNLYEEINPDYVTTNGIHVVRRLSGGGAVYHDLGNLNFSFITNGQEDLHNFAKFTTPIVNALEKLGVQAELRQRSSLFVGDKKISGNAQYASRGRLLTHGTLLFDSDLAALERAIGPRSLRVESKAVKSVRAKVTNILNLLPQLMSMGQFRQTILGNIFAGEPITTYDLSPSDWEQIEKIRSDRYDTWDWNFGRSPRFTIKKSELTTHGRIELRISVVKGMMTNLKLDAQFIDRAEAEEVAAQLVGQRYDRPELETAVRHLVAQSIFGKLSPSEFITLLF